MGMSGELAGVFGAPADDRPKAPASETPKTVDPSKRRYRSNRKGDSRIARCPVSPHWMDASKPAASPILHAK